MNKKERESFIKNFRESLNSSEIAIVVRQNGITVSESNVLRKSLFEAKANYKVTKNTLAKIAVRDTKFNVLENDFFGPSAVAYSNDPVTISKIVCEFGKGKDGRFNIVSGYYNGSSLSKDSVMMLATLPSLDVLRSSLIATIKTPSQNVYSCVRGVPEKLARVVNEYSKK